MNSPARWGGGGGVSVGGAGWSKGEEDVINMERGVLGHNGRLDMHPMDPAAWLCKRRP